MPKLFLQSRLDLSIPLKDLEGTKGVAMVVGAIKGEGAMEPLNAPHIMLQQTINNKITMLLRVTMLHRRIMPHKLTMVMEPHKALFLGGTMELILEIMLM